LLLPLFGCKFIRILKKIPQKTKMSLQTAKQGAAVERYPVRHTNYNLPIYAIFAQFIQTFKKRR
jgi:hypothetical protein